jgi:polyisoprenoid-binding protein YceI
MTTTQPTNDTLAGLTPGTWTVDPAHSTVGFVARHMMITKVHGHFTDFDGRVTVAEDPTASRVTANVRLASVDTGSEDRDAHLRSPDFFDVEAHPEMTFRSTAVRADGDAFRLDGDLTIADVSHPVSFALEFDGLGRDPWGNRKAGFTATTELNRKDWGLAWNVALETGGLLVSERIRIELDIQLVKVDDEP